MKVFINGQIFDAGLQPIAIVFDCDEDRKAVAAQLSGMPELDGVRVFLMCPDSVQVADAERIMDEAVQAAS